MSKLLVCLVLNGSRVLKTCSERLWHVQIEELKRQRDGQKQEDSERQAFERNVAAR